MRYVLGVDGGNSKTDYLLCMEDGSFVDVYRTGSCSHEHCDDSYDGMERKMREQLDVILKRNHITPKDIAAAGFGLAGADMPYQKVELSKKIKQMGFDTFKVSNDGILGVKAASDCGAGVCVVNGTATVTVGIDKTGKELQVGGIGDMAGDLAGGGYARRRIMYKLYSHYYRCGPSSSMFPQLMEILETDPDRLADTISDYHSLWGKTKAIMILAGQHAGEGDKVAQSVFDEMGVSMGESAAGCIRLLHFDQVVDVVLVGSIWHKIPYGGMKNIFKNTVEVLTNKKLNMMPLNAPPAVGGVLWANEMLFGTIDPVARENILGTLTLRRYEELVHNG